MVERENLANKIKNKTFVKTTKSATLAEMLIEKEAAQNDAMFKKGAMDASSVILAMSEIVKKLKMDPLLSQLGPSIFDGNFYHSIMTILLAMKDVIGPSDVSVFDGADNENTRELLTPVCHIMIYKGTQGDFEQKSKTFKELHDIAKKYIARFDNTVDVVQILNDLQAQANYRRIANLNLLTESLLRMHMRFVLQGSNKNEVKTFIDRLEVGIPFFWSLKAPSQVQLNETLEFLDQKSSKSKTTLMIKCKPIFIELSKFIRTTAEIQGVPNHTQASWDQVMEKAPIVAIANNALDMLANAGLDKIASKTYLQSVFKTVKE